MTGKEVVLGVIFAGAAVGIAMMGSRETTPYAYLFDRTKAANEQQQFLAAVIQHYGVTQAELQPLSSRMRSVWRDLPMIVFVAREAHRPLLDVAEMRRAGQDWIDIYRKLDLPLKPLFEGVPGTAPEPYKAAWVEWRAKFRPALDDQQMREMAMLQLAHRISGEEVPDILKQVRRGATTEQIIARAAPPSPQAAAAAEPSPASKAGHKTGAHGR